MNNELSSEYLDTLRLMLRKVYSLMQKTGDAPKFDKGIVKGMILAGQKLNVISKDELTEIINQERLAVFGTRDKPLGNQSIEMDIKSLPKFHRSKTGDLDFGDLLDIPTFWRNPKKY